ncbi:MAG: antibiotic biosynthesis monooxygenase [Hyphomonadaceae bacterium]|nr:antibiotic biosynthesis monooxygenase [Hyphomonadaceae bacterium]
MAIKRIWHGWTTQGNADNYQDIVTGTVFPRIEAKQIPGYLGVELLRRDHGHEVEFVTIMTFESLDAVKGIQGEDYEKSYVPEEAQQVLKRWDDYCSHYTEIDERSYS